MQTENRKPKIWQASILCIIAFISLIYVGGAAQTKFGFYGTLAIQAIIILLAIIFVVITKGKLKDAFLFDKPNLRKTFGALVMYVGTYLFIMCITLLIAYLFPEEYNALSDDMLYSFTDRVNPLSMFLIVSVVPAICEEFFFRGALTYAFKGLKPYIVIAASGIIFGIFHTSFIRFFPTSVLGILFAYIYLKTNNMLYPMMLHFINNAMSSISVLAADTQMLEQVSAMTIPLSSVGVYFIICAACPFIINAGNRLFEPKKVMHYNPYIKDDKERRKKLITGIIAASFALTGFLMIQTDLSNKPELVNTDKTVTVQSYETHVADIEFTNEIYNVYNINYELYTQHGLCEIRLEDKNGNVLVQDICHEGSFAYAIPLEEGTYSITVESHIDDVWEYAQKKGLNYTKDGDLVTLNMGYDLSGGCEIHYKIIIN